MTTAKRKQPAKRGPRVDVIGDEPTEAQADEAEADAEMVEVTERIYEQQADGRTVLAAAPGQQISAARAAALGIGDKAKRGPKER